MDPYKILGVDEGASPDEIRGAYRKLVAKYHPDAGGDSWAFQLVQEAYESLTGKRKPKSKTKARRKTKRNSTSSESKTGSNRQNPPDSTTNRGADSDPDRPKPGSTSEFDFTPPKTRWSQKPKSRSKDKILLFNVVGAVGGAICALILGWLIINSQWLKHPDARQSSAPNVNSTDDSTVSSNEISEPAPQIDQVDADTERNGQRRTHASRTEKLTAPRVYRPIQQPAFEAVAPHNPPKSKYVLTFQGNGGVQFPNLKFDRDLPWTIDVVFTPGDRAGSAVFSNVQNAGIAINVGEHKPVFAIRDGGHYDRLYADKEHTSDTPIYLSIVIDNQEIKMFIDGKLQAGRLRIPPAFRPSTKTFFLGANPSSKNRPQMCFTGTIQALRVSSMARYVSDFSPVDNWEPDADTILLCDFGMETGITLTDKSTNGNHGGIMGANWDKIPDEKPR